MTEDDVTSFLAEPNTESRVTSNPSESQEQINPPKQRGKVHFNSTSEVNDTTNQRLSLPLYDQSVSPITTPKKIKVKTSPQHSRNNSLTSLLRFSPQTEKDDPFSDPLPSPVMKLRPSFLRNTSFMEGLTEEGIDMNNEKAFSALAAQERAKKVASSIRSHSAPVSGRTSLDEDLREPYPVRIDDIPLMSMGDAMDSDTEDSNIPKKLDTSEAHKLVQAHFRKMRRDTGFVTPRSGRETPNEEQTDAEYVARPQQYRMGVLSSLLKLSNVSHDASQSRRGSLETNTPGSLASSGTTTPKTKATKWYNQKNQSRDTLAALVEASAILSAQANSKVPIKSTKRPSMVQSNSEKFINSAKNKLSKKLRIEDEKYITIHIAETLSRQKYLIKLCRALMSYGAPTHRLEEYMRMSARVLEIDGQFLYFPGCMIISFDDASTHTTEVKLVRAVQAVDLGKLKSTHEVYKEVVHDVIGVEEATQRLEWILTDKPKHSAWVLVLVYGLSSAFVAPFAFQARFIDLPICFILGCITGILQLIVAPRSELYSNVFVISAAVITSFLARAFGSITYHNSTNTIFCFSAMAQSSIALILPGYTVLCASLELQSRSIVSGSVRMVYAIMYSMFLGYGITVGTVLYGLMDLNATSATTCPSGGMNDYIKWAFVPLFTMTLCIINQAKWRQIPTMLLISFVGYVVNFFSTKKFPTSPQIANTFGAFVVGVMGNMYSRVRHGVAAAALIPAIFVQVPSGLAASGSLLAGLNSADQITNTTTYSNGTSKLNGTVITNVISSNSGGVNVNSIVFSVGYSMVQVAIGITVGLFLSAIVVYPMGKRRSGLFSF